MMPMRQLRPLTRPSVRMIDPLQRSRAPISQLRSSGGISTSFVLLPCGSADPFVKCIIRFERMFDLEPQPV